MVGWFSATDHQLAYECIIEVAPKSLSSLPDPGANTSLHRRAFLFIPLANEIMSRKSLTDKLPTPKNGVHGLQ
jgi:hypothetical protein